MSKKNDIVSFYILIIKPFKFNNYNNNNIIIKIYSFLFKFKLAFIDVGTKCFYFLFNNEYLINEALKVVKILLIR